MSAKVLGQLAPSAATYTASLYNVPSGKQAICSTLMVTNRSNTSDTFRIRIAVANASVDAKQYLFYDTSINANSSIPLTVGLTLAAGDYVYAGSNGGNLTFNLFGDEQ